MRVGHDGRQHLTYCLNVHPGETWAENLESIRTHACAVRERLGIRTPFGLGLRLGSAAAAVLTEPAELDAFRRILRERDLYVFTINGFPFGAFHGAAVKDRVYAPDWRDIERADYTKRLATILAAVLPEGVTGSISTVPGSYKAWVRDAADRRAIAANLVGVAGELARLADRTGRVIHLGLEPEPDCMLESTEDVLRFFEQDIPRALQADRSISMETVRRHLGVCLDACHMALQFESAAESVRRLADAGVRISKVQISAALQARGGPHLAERLAAFADSVYLHQARVRGADGRVRRFSDLPEALQRTQWLRDPNAEWRVHCHVPLYWQGDGDVGSTAGAIDSALFAAVTQAGCKHLELETYTFGVLPGALQERGVVGSIVDEYNWVFDHADI